MEVNLALIALGVICVAAWIINLVVVFRS